MELFCCFQHYINLTDRTPPGLSCHNNANNNTNSVLSSYIAGSIY